MLSPYQQEKRGGGWLILLASFALAALLTLGAAVGTSLLHRQSPLTDPAEVPMAQR